MMPALDRPAGVAAGLQTHGRLVGETSPTPSRGGQPAINTVSRRLKAPARWAQKIRSVTVVEVVRMAAILGYAPRRGGGILGDLVRS